MMCRLMSLDSRHAGAQKLRPSSHASAPVVSGMCHNACSVKRHAFSSSLRIV